MNETDLHLRLIHQSPTLETKYAVVRVVPRSARESATDSVMRVATAQPSEQIAALQLLFQHLPGASALPRIRAAEQLLKEPSARLLVARQGTTLLGATLGQVLPGATGVLWPPQASAGIADPNQIEDALLREALNWLRRQKARLAQTILARDEAHLAGSLLRGGFVKPTRLRYLRCEPAAVRPHPIGGIFETYQTATPAVFQETLLRSYAGSLDFPEVDGRRSLAEILQGYQAAGFDPARWWLKRENERPAGVLILSEIEPRAVWDLTYIGVVPESRRRGHGRELVRKAIAETRSGCAELLTVCVDERNIPALQLYAELGFEEYDVREVFLALWEEA
jgi:mycothiol synthase